MPPPTFQCKLAAGCTEVTGDGVITVPFPETFSGVFSTTVSGSFAIPTGSVVVDDVRVDEFDIRLVGFDPAETVTVYWNAMGW